jgi:uncharacterized protein RhaS with RHS repeats
VRLTGPQVTTSYYYAGGQRVALRKNGVLRWLLGDHLGSTSLATNDTGGQVSRQLYYPFGETRWTSVASLPTDFQCELSLCSACSIISSGRMR